MWILAAILAARLVFLQPVVPLQVDVPLQADEEGARPALPDWLERVQTYCIVPVLPERALELHVTVNGVWGGMGGTHPILTHVETGPAVQAAFGRNGAAFIRACREAGLIPAGSINGLEGFGAMRERWPDLEAMACRDAAGEPAASEEGMLLMCTNNPAWLEWETEFGKAAIRDGAELILVDTPMSSAFIAGFLGGGFCPFCVQRFCRHLEARFTKSALKEHLDLDALDSETLVERLSVFQFAKNPLRRAFLEDSAGARLFQEFIRCQEEASFETRKTLVSTLRAHAAGLGREAAFCTNAADLGTGNPGGHWIRALMFADIFDLFVYEQAVLPDGNPFGRALRPPRGKWAAYHKLAHAVHGRRAPAVVHAHHMGALLSEVLEKSRTCNTWMAVQSAEAYAAGGAYVQYYVEPEAGRTLFLDTCWTGSAEHAAFVQAHRDLFEGELRSGARAAFLFLLNERGRAIPAVFPSYLGLAQALVEGNRAFDVVFAGDGRFVADRLEAETLAPYGVLIVPSPIDPTDKQQHLVQDFVRGGGTVICAEPDRLGLQHGEPELADPPVPCAAGAFELGDGRVLVLDSEVSPTRTRDEGSDFFKTYSASRRERILALADRLGLPALLTRPADGLVCAFPVVQPERGRIIVHLVNYDIDFEKDAIRQKTGIAVTLPRPAFLDGAVQGVLCAPGREDASILIEVVADRDTTPADSVRADTISVRADTMRADTIAFSVPRLDICATVVITAP